MTWLALLTTAMHLVTGVIAGRYLYHRRVDKVERDAWDDGYCEALRTVLRLNAAELDQLSRDLDATVEHAVPDGWPGWN
jgi:hypothetical protein